MEAPGMMDEKHHRRGRNAMMYGSRSLAAAAACSAATPVALARSVDSQVIRPSKIMDFNVLYARELFRMPWPDGKGGAAIGLGDPVYLAIADDATIIARNRRRSSGTSMPAFAQHSGGMLTDDQINVIVRGIRARWAKPDAVRDADPPPYAAQNPAIRSAERMYMALLLVVSRRGRPRRQAPVPSWTARISRLVSDQGLRTTVIVGRPEWALPIGAATCPASRCRRRMSPMSWPGLPRSGRNSQASPIRVREGGIR
jgi:cytochrome c oxidase cbb3-type subunit III